MKLRNTFVKGGYSRKTYDDYLSSHQPVLVEGQGIERQVKFINNKPTDELQNLRIGVYFKGFGFTKVKLPKSFRLSSQIHDLESIELVQPEACIVRRNVYVRAKDIKLAK